jgi:CRISPR system Cascade subunit CasE
MSDTERLHMVQLRLNARALALFGRGVWQQHGHMDEDDGLLAHALLAALFGEGLVQPFTLAPGKGEGANSRELRLLGYSRRSADDLREYAEASAAEEVKGECYLHSLASKLMPDAWSTGRRLRFEVRVCPVVRLSSGGWVRAKDGLRAVRYGKGSEVDAWVHRSLMQGEDVPEATRADVYSAWLRRRMESAVTIEEAALHRFRRVRLLRYDHQSRRSARTLERPDAVLRGCLRVKDERALQRLLRRGVGRHCAYGFGMLLLRPAP